MITIHDDPSLNLRQVAGIGEDYEETFDLVDYDFRSDPTRRGFLQVLGAGLLIAVAIEPARGQQPQVPAKKKGGGFGGRGPTNIAARLHIGKDGSLTVMTGKVECGQGARAELTQAAAEELRVGANAIRLIMADTGVVPDDGGTYGSQSTPNTVPSIRRGCAAAREMLASLAAKRWSVDPRSIEIHDGKAIDPASKQTLGYADLAADEAAAKSFASTIPADVALTPVAKWEVLGTSIVRPNARDIVTGGHQYPSDVARPGLLHGKVLRRPSFGAKLLSVDLEAAKVLEGVVVVRDNDFIGVAAPTSALAQQAIETIADSAKWETTPHPSSSELFDYLRQHARGGVPKNPFADEVAKAPKTLKQSYNVSYIQHTPMEPRAALADWRDGKLTVWTGSQAPFMVRTELVRAFGVPEDRVRVIIPDFGGGFGGKHSGECAVEAARLAKGAGKPVRLVWTRAEEFTWAQFRPAAAIEAEASLDDSGRLTSWHYININSGNQEVQTPYKAGKTDTRYVDSSPPLRHGSYRALAATANTFGRECFMDEMAGLAGIDSLEFRLSHLGPGRLKNVLQEAARRFDWASRARKKEPNVGIGLACGTDKGSFVAACVEVVVDPDKGSIAVRHVCQAYECGKILNPANLLTQVKGGLIMGLGPALWEESRFEKGAMLNASFGGYRVPRFADIPELDIHLLDRPDLPSAGAGETPVIAVAPAIANAVFAATGVRARSMPIKLPGSKEA
jgi:CO/xanthine dehydrogenase Mo-binding subunit